MKLFSAQQIKEWDQDTLVSKGIASIDLMETASNAFAESFITKYPDLETPIAVFCGTGNNGGDGLAIARILSMKGYDVKVYLADWGQEKSNDFNINLQRLPGYGHIPLFVINLNELPVLASNEIIIDALLGTGLNRPLEGNIEDLVHWINSLPQLKVSVDIPSGMFADRNTPEAIHANRTITFQIPKLSFLLPDSEQFTGKWETVDIGLNPQFILHTRTNYYLIEQELIKKILFRRKKFSHKGIYGHALLINGSHGKAGAAILSAKACLRSGVGLLTNHIPSINYPTLQMAVPEAMADVDDHQYYWSTLPKDMKQYDAVGVGCGIDLKESTHRAFEALLNQQIPRLVIDADGINLLSAHQTLLYKLPSGTILTPHVKEFDRLFGKCNSCFDRLERLRTAATSYNITIILKGAHSAIAFSDGTIYFNCTGNPGMATAGAGDVLTGILTGLLAQGYDSRHAALLGTYVHGLAGDLAYADASYESLIASDIVEHLGKAFRCLINH